MRKIICGCCEHTIKVPEGEVIYDFTCEKCGVLLNPFGQVLDPDRLDGHDGEFDDDY